MAGWLAGWLAVGLLLLFICLFCCFLCGLLLLLLFVLVVIVGLLLLLLLLLFSFLGGGGEGRESHNVLATCNMYLGDNFAETADRSAPSVNAITAPSLLLLALGIEQHVEHAGTCR